jgi:hypothetical protein
MPGGRPTAFRVERRSSIRCSPDNIGPFAVYGPLFVAQQARQLGKNKGQQFQGVISAQNICNMAHHL